LNRQSLDQIVGIPKRKLCQSMLANFSMNAKAAKHYSSRRVGIVMWLH